MRFVLILGPDEKLLANSLAWLLCKIWNKQGHKVTVTAGAPVKADCGLLHVDATRVDPSFLSGFDPAMPILNRQTLDISKRIVSRHLVSLGDGYEGAVIVKTNDNAYGIPAYPPSPAHDRMLEARASVTLGNWREKGMLPVSDYPILRSKRDVPPWVWQNPDLIVEKFLPEVEDGLFVLRLWVFLGPREFALKVYGTHPVVKSGERVRFEYIDEIPDELRRERERLGFDYGKFDYVMHDGKAVLLDANKTPSISNPDETPEYAFNLAAALTEMFPELG